MTAEEKIKALKQSLIENIADVQKWIEDPETTDEDWRYHVGVKSGFKEVLQALEEAGV
jgi:hypothetical protein